MPGVLRTVVGYTGGSTPNPTYESIGDHTEALRVTFDPRAVSAALLLTTFWTSHQPMPMTFTGHQYRSAVFWHDDEQRALAEDVRLSLMPADTPFSCPLDNTALERAGSFYRAEEYHQRFLQKQRSGMLWSPNI